MLIKKHLGIDLGTDATRIYLNGVGVVLNEPSIVAFNNKTNRVVSVGTEAKRMLSRTPSHITALRPINHGVIADFDMAREMIERFLKSEKLPWSIFTDVVTAVPTNLTEVERKSVEDLLKESGGRNISIIEQPIIAALGSGLQIHEPSAYFVVDIGAGSTDMAIISLDGVVVSKRIKMAGDYLNNEIIKGVRDELKLLIGEPTAEEIKVNIATVIPQGGRSDITVRGRDVSSGLPREVVVKDTQVRYWITRPMRTIVEALKDLIDITPPELVGDIYKNGIYFCGGGSLLKGIATLAEKEVGVPVRIVEEPLLCVVRGTGIIAENPKLFEHLLNVTPTIK